MLKIPFFLFLLLAILLSPAASAQLRISEFVADNEGTLLDEDDDASDWIEIQNTTAGLVSTAGYALSDDPAEAMKWLLPAVEIPSGGFLLVFASNKDRTDPASELHANFSLSAAGEYLALFAPDGSPLSEFDEFPQQFYGTSFGAGASNGTIAPATFVPRPTAARWLVPASDIGDTWQSPGFDDSSWQSAQTGLGFGYDAFPEFVGAGGDTETLARNVNATVYVRIPFNVADPLEVQSMTLKAFFDDGFVAYLNGDQVAAENGPSPLLFSSSATASEEVRVGDEMIEYPLSFAGKLVAGENILAFQMMNNSAFGSDALLVPELVGEVQDLAGGATTGYFLSATPAAPNTPVEHTGFVRDTAFDIDRGFFDSPIDVTITCPTPGATIVYTTDGNAPTLVNGIQVPAADPATPPSATVTISTTTPLRAAAFKSGFRPSNVDTQTYLYLEDVLDQPDNPPGYPVPWIQRNGTAIGGDYGMAPAIVGPIYSRTELKEALLEVPTISIVTDIDNLFDPQIGIQVNPVDAGPGSERRVSVEMLGFEDGTPLQLDAGMLMNGNASRGTSRPKHNFRLAFRNEYGAGRLDYPLFGEDAPTERFNQIILRGGNGNSWIHPTASVYNNAMYIRDQWFRDALHAMGYPEALQREVHVYFNGLYWGMHHLFERIEEEWSAERFGGTEDQWEGFRIVGGNNIEVIAGTPAEESARMLDSWRATLDAALAGDLAGVEQYLDLDHYIDYILLNFYAGNNDWDQNNVRAMRRTDPPGKFQFFCHDAERAGFNALNTADININVTTKNTLNGPTSINAALRSNPEYALRFADRAYKHLFNGGALTPENAAALWEARAEGIRNAMKAESARWGDFRGNPPRTLVQWQAALDREYDDWFPHRTPVAIGQFRATGIYPDVDPPVYNQHGGMVPVGFGAVLSNTGGEIYYTIDGSDPRLSGGAVNPAAIQLDGSLVTSEIVAAGSDWLFLDDGVDQGTAWRELAFNDDSWSTGTAPLGYGNINLIGVLPNPINDVRALTTYFRREVNLTGTSLLTEATVEIMADGGAVVYVNGTEIGRDNMPAGTITFATASLNDGNPEGVFNSYSFDPAVLIDGTNIIAVESHNSNAASSDMVIDVRIETTGLNPSGGAIIIDETKTLKARSLDAGEWSALAEATFLTGVPATASNLVISELHYNPLGPDESGEFIELMNISADFVSLAGVSFTSGIEYNFPTYAVLAPGERLVLSATDYVGSLNNGGETITLATGDGTIIQSFRYNDRAPWPIAADGDGFSLTLIAPESAPDHDNAGSWRRSVNSGGSPGGSDATSFAGATSAGLLEYALGSATTSIAPELQSIEVSGVTDDYLVARYPVNLAADDVIYEVQFSTDLRSWTTASDGFLGSINDSGVFTDYLWRAPAPTSSIPPPRFARVMISLRP